MPSQTKRKGSTAKKESPSKKGSSATSSKASGKDAKNTKKGSAKNAAKTPTKGEKKSNMTVNADFLASLISTKCSEFKLEDLYTVKKEDKVCDVWGKLIERMIMGAPVVDEEGNFEGFIDTADIASYLVAKFGDPILRASIGVDRLSVAMTQELKIWMDKTVGDVMAFDYPTKARPPLCYANYSLLSAFEPLGMQSSLHRVAVVESPTSNRLVTIITQSQALKHIFENVSHLGSRKNKPIEECIDVVKTKGIFVVTKDHIALDAFQHMLAHGVSALAVVSEPGGQVKGVISLRDLQVIGNNATDLWKLYIGVDDFLKEKAVKRVITEVERELRDEHAHEEETKTHDGGKTEASDVEMKEEKVAEPEPKASKSKSGSKKTLPAADSFLASNIQCFKGETFMSAIKKLQGHEVHRLFVTNEDKIPFGVVSIKEVLKEIMH